MLIYTLSNSTKYKNNAKINTFTICYHFEIQNSTIETNIKPLQHKTNSSVIIILQEIRNWPDLCVIVTHRAVLKLL